MNKPIKYPNSIQSFFISCSGADRSILLLCPTEWNKYSGIGATVFLTACLATLSGGYALFSVFENYTVSIIFGIFWGFVIFNLDRYIVLSLRKPKIPSSREIYEAPENERKSLRLDRRRLLWNQFLMATPRILIALIIAITVSKPLELQLFHKRINNQLGTQAEFAIEKYKKDYEVSINNLNSQIEDFENEQDERLKLVYTSNPVYSEVQEKLSILNKTKNDKDSNRKQAKKIRDQNWETVYVKVREVSELGDVYFDTKKKRKLNSKGRAKNREVKKLDVEIKNLEIELKELDAKKEYIEEEFKIDVAKIKESYTGKIQALKVQRDEMEKNYITGLAGHTKRNRNSNDLLAQLEALGNISEFGNPVWWASLIITFLFILLECAPVVIKLLTKRGPYEEILDRIEYEHFIKEQEAISKINNTVNVLLDKAKKAAILEGSVFMQVEKQRLDHELQNNQMILDNLAKKQEVLAKMAIDEWYENELKAKTKSIFSIEDNFWKLKSNSTIKVEYLFRNGKIDLNDLILTENGNIKQYSWRFIDQSKSEIQVIRKGINSFYKVNELNETSLKLEDKKTGEVLEFVN